MERRIDPNAWPGQAEILHVQCLIEFYNRFFDLCFGENNLAEANYKRGYLLFFQFEGISVHHTEKGIWHSC